MREQLDLSMVRLVQENNVKMRKEPEELMTQKASTHYEVDQQAFETRRKQFYQNSIQDSKNSKKQMVKGKTYSNKKAAVVSIAGILVFCGMIHGITAYEKVSTYDDMLSQKMEEQLTEDQISAYQKDQEKGNFISNAIDKYQQITDANDSLNSSDYNIHGQNIADPSKEYLSFDEDSLIILSNKDYDAIDVATDEVIEEYQRRGR